MTEATSEFPVQFLKSEHGRLCSTDVPVQGPGHLPAWLQSTFIPLGTKVILVSMLKMDFGSSWFLSIPNSVSLGLSQSEVLKGIGKSDTRNTDKSHTWWHWPVITSQAQTGSQGVKGLSGLQSKVMASLENLLGPYLKIKSKTKAQGYS